MPLQVPHVEQHSSVVSARSSGQASSCRGSTTHSSREAHRHRHHATPSAFRKALCCDAISVQLDGERLESLTNVSCVIHGGRVTAVVNICGTHSGNTLLRTLSGQVPVVKGSIVLNGVPVSASAYLAQVELLDGGDAPVLMEKLTVRESLEYALAMRVSKATRPYTVDDVLQQLLLTPFQNEVVKRSSLYLQRRVALGKALLRNPTVLLLHEPTEGLATHEAQQFLSILAKLAAPAAADVEAQQLMSRSLAATATAAPNADRVSSLGASVSQPDILRGQTSSALPASLPVSAVYTPRQARHPQILGNLSLRQQTATRASSSTSAVQGGFDDSSAGVSVAESISSTTERIVVLSMMQPRWTLLQYVSDVVLIDGSHCVFSGAANTMITAQLPRLMASTPPAEGSRVRRGRAAVGGPVAAAASASTSALVFGQRSHHSHENEEEAFDSITAVIRDQRRGEEFVHELYRIASRYAPFSEYRIEELGDERSCSDDTNENCSAVGRLYASFQQSTCAEVAEFMKECANGTITLSTARYPPPSGFLQLVCLLKYGLLELRHNLLLRLIMLVCGLGTAVALAAIYGLQKGQIGMQNRLGIMFFLVSSVVLQAVLSVDHQRSEYATFHQSAAAGYFSAFTYLVFRVLTAALYRFGLASFVALLVFFLSNFGEPWREYRIVFELAVIMAVTSLCCHFVIWLMCTLHPSERIGRLLLFSFYTLNIILAGMVLNLSTLPTAIQWISFFAIMRLAFESAILTQFVGKSFDCNSTVIRNTTVEISTFEVALPQNIFPQKAAWTSSLRYDEASDSDVTGINVTTTVQTATCYTGSQYASFLGFHEQHRWTNVAVLSGICAVVVFCSLVSMTWLRPRHRSVAH